MTPRTQSRVWMWRCLGASSIVVAALGLALGACAPLPAAQNSTTQDTTSTSTQPPFNVSAELTTDSVSDSCSATWVIASTDSTIEVNYQVNSPAGPKTGTFLDSAVVTWVVPESLAYKVSWSMNTSFWSSQDSFVVAPHSCPGVDST